MFNKRPQEELKERFITHRYRRKNTALFDWPHREVKAGYKQRQREVGSQGTCIYQGLWMECLGVLRLRLKWSIQKSKAFTSSTGVLSKVEGGGTRARPWKVGKTITKATGEVIPGTDIYL